MTKEFTEPSAMCGVSVTRRTVLGIIAAGIVAPLIGVGTARADAGASGETQRGTEDEYEIPDGIGSTEWW